MAQVPEFAADGDNTTSWRSDNTAAVNFTVGLQNATSLSKIFIYFVTSTPLATELQFRREGETQWRTLQKYSTDCNAYFMVSPGGR